MPTIGIRIPAPPQQPLELVEIDPGDEVRSLRRLVGNHRMVASTIWPAFLAHINLEARANHLEPNRRAGLLLCMHAGSVSGRPSGPVILTGPRERTGNLTSVPPVLVRDLLDAKYYRVEYRLTPDAPWQRGPAAGDWPGAYEHALDVARTRRPNAQIRVVPCFGVDGGA